MTAFSGSGFLEKVKKFVVFEEDVGMVPQLFGAVGLTMTAGWLAQLGAPMAFSDWSVQIPYWVGGIFLTPYLLKAAAHAAWSGSLAVLWVENQMSVAMWELGKFGAFVGALLGVSVTTAHAAHWQHVFSLPIPEPASLREWIEAYWQNPVFVTFVGLSFVLYRGGVWLWRRRPVVVESWNHARSV